MLGAGSLAALALGGCSAGGSRPIIKIGLSAPFSGFDESIGYSVIGVVRLAVRERNLSGGVAGYSVELAALDDANDAETAVQRARELMIDPAVMAVLGGFDGPAALAAARAYRQAGMPFVTLATSDALSGLAFRLSGWESEAGWQAGRYALRELAAQRIAVISERRQGSDTLTDAFVTVTQNGGARILYRASIDRWQLDFEAVVSAAAMVAPDVVFFAGRAAEAGELVRQMRAAGMTAAFLGGPGVDDPRLAQIAGKAAQGAHYVSLGFALERAIDGQTRERLSKASLRPPGAYTVPAYDGAHVLLDALERAIRSNGRPTPAGVGEMLRSSRYLGVSGEIGFDTDGNRKFAPPVDVKVVQL